MQMLYLCVRACVCMCVCVAMLNLPRFYILQDQASDIPFCQHRLIQKLINLIGH